MPKVKVKPRGIISKIEFEKMLQKAKDPMHKCYLVMLYVFGFRVSEFCGDKKRDISPMRKGHELQIVLKEGTNQEYIIINHKALKKRAKGSVIEVNKIILPVKEIPYYGVIREWYIKVEHGEPIFPRTRVTLWRILKQYNPETWNHLFRYTRATLFVEAGHDVSFLMNWFNWGSANQAMSYTKRKPITSAKLY